ncbi:Signal transduction histidine kinase [Brevibacterium siliguriense]|uniref:histidine kinase n=1 Tax=Brevibacterium siliguriense TaxID=1136497 RepID=A0A1H1RG83_9MICO|nr:histidine kinase [Brevibacterium siliguriense]SDS33909.1 Signal transduction histidine kinase [Brevibacterium siliguriense]
MRRLLTWLWLVPIPLTFALELLIGSGWLLILGNIIAVALGLPILIRAQLRPVRSARPEWAVLGLLVGLALAAVAATLSLTTVWLSLAALAMLARAASGRLSILSIVVLAVANVVCPLVMADGATFALMVLGLVIAAIAIGLMLRSNDRTLIERQATAAEAERRRIATELHDLIAHEVTGIVVLAQAAGRSDNPDLRTTALTKIEESGTRALEEIRRLVSDARSDTRADVAPVRAASATSDPSSAAASRTPVATGPQALHDRIAAFGESATITIDTPAEVAAPVWPVLDRVLVESLTNVRRHAGADAPVTVTVTSEPTDLTAPDGTENCVGSDGPTTLIMTVANGPGSGGIGAGSGTGLNSLRVRAGHLGGRVSAGPEHGGGWSVVARLPLNPQVSYRTGENR